MGQKKKSDAGFYPLPKGDGLYLAGLTAFTAVAFLLPDLRHEEFLGVSLFGWWMAALMFFGPLVALFRLLEKKK